MRGATGKLLAKMPIVNPPDHAFVSHFHYPAENVLPAAGHRKDSTFPHTHAHTQGQACPSSVCPFRFGPGRNPKAVEQEQEEEPKMLGK